MSIEMRRLERARPEVAPPTPGARAQARAALGGLIDAEAPGAYTPAPRRERPQLSAFVFIGGSLGALIIAIAALVLLHHGRAAHSTAAAPHAAVRGPIVTSDGQVLAAVQPRFTVRIETGLLPRKASARRAEFRRLDRVIEGEPSVGECRISATRTELLAQSACIVATEQSRGLSDIVIASDQWPSRVRPIARDRAAFPGVVLERVEVRSYPLGDLAAQVLGTVGSTGSVPAASSALVGQSGLESAYDRYLAAGDTLHVSIDTALQRVGERSLAHTIKANPPASAGAFVAMDPRTGQILALGSAGGLSFDRAISGVGPAGSIFMPLTAVAGLESGVWTAAQRYDDTGRYCLPGGGRCLHNAGGAAFGELDIVAAIRSADEIFFDNLAGLMARGGHDALWRWMNLFGIGHRTGVDAGGEMRGYTQKPRTVSESIDLASGEGILDVTPLQVAVAYAAIANGGRIVHPHVGLSVTDPSGATVTTVKVSDGTVRSIPISPGVLQTVRAAMRAVVSAPGGTAQGVFGTFPEQVYGKTGTAQVGGKPSNAWFVGYVPASATRRPILVVVNVMEGRYGGITAAPVARQILSQWFFGTPGPFIS